jgi:hypothetical protein
MLSVAIGLLGITVSFGTYFAGRRNGRRQERDRKEREVRLERERERHALKATLVADYVTRVRSHRDSGPHALCRLGLDQLGSDTLIREAIDEMQARAGQDPWGTWRQHVADVDLVAFFRFTREHDLEVPYDGVSVENVSHRVKALGGARPRP